MGLSAVRTRLEVMRTLTGREPTLRVPASVPLDPERPRRKQPQDERSGRHGCRRFGQRRPRLSDPYHAGQDHQGHKRSRTGAISRGGSAVIEPQPPDQKARLHEDRAGNRIPQTKTHQARGHQPLTAPRARPSGPQSLAFVRGSSSACRGAPRSPYRCIRSRGRWDLAPASKYEVRERKAPPAPPGPQS